MSVILLKNVLEHLKRYSMFIVGECTVNGYLVFIGEPSCLRSFYTTSLCAIWTALLWVTSHENFRLVCLVHC